MNKNLYTNGFFSFLKYTFIIFAAQLATSCGPPFENYCSIHWDTDNAIKQTTQPLVETQKYNVGKIQSSNIKTLGIYGYHLLYMVKTFISSSLGWVFSLWYECYAYLTTLSEAQVIFHSDPGRTIVMGRTEWRRKKIRKVDEVDDKGRREGNGSERKSVKKGGE
jgi:hypothetical protein